MALLPRQPKVLVCTMIASLTFVVAGCGGTGDQSLAAAMKVAREFGAAADRGDVKTACSYLTDGARVEVGCPYGRADFVRGIAVALSRMDSVGKATITVTGDGNYAFDPDGTSAMVFRDGRWLILPN
jgi:hypothetical protein